MHCARRALSITPYWPQGLYSVGERCANAARSPEQDEEVEFAARRLYRGYMERIRDKVKEVRAHLYT